NASESEFQPHDFIKKLKKWTTDSSEFNYYSIEAISELELHIRTLVSLIEVICKGEIRIRHDLREKIYTQLGKFAEIHFRSTEVNEEGFNKVFKSKFDEFNPRSNDNKIRKDGKRNYNIDFLLLHLRDTLHCMKDDENKFLEIWNRIKALLHVILGIAPGIAKTGGTDLPINNGKEPLAFPHSLWFGALDITQDLIAKTQRDSTLGICYYLALESLQKAPSSFIRFKAIEILIKLSKRNTLLYNIIENDFRDYKYFLDSVEGSKLHYMIEAIHVKISQDEKLVDTSKDNINNLKEKEKVITTYGLTLPYTIAPSDDLISDIVTTELSCPVTYQIPSNFQILPCEHLISPEALQQIINKTSQPTCPLCRKIIDLNSVINLPQSAIYQGIRNYLSEDNNNNVVQDHNKNISDE
ncbi:7131_t:CDS:2, partial [Racocetra fulgida]